MIPALAPAPANRTERSWRLFAWLLTAVVAAGICHSLLRIPIQVTDSLIPILVAQSTPSVSEAFVGNLRTAAYLRPLRIAQIQMIVTGSRGRYFLGFKGFHVVLIGACFVLFAAILGIRTRPDFLVLPFALTVLTGLHTFFGTVSEAYPINHFLEIAVLCLLAFVLAQSKGGWWSDVMAAVVFVVAALTLESGLLVWVVIVAGWLVGMRGISRNGVIATTLLLGGYFFLRFGYLSTGAPTLLERSSGFGITRLEPDELVRRFGEWPYGFYAYNVISSLSSVLFSEPRSAVWEAAADFAAGGVAPGTLVNLGSSAITTALIGWFGISRARAWRRRAFSSADQILIVSLAVLFANAVISYGYAKDEIMSTGGIFYALGAFVALRQLLERLSAPSRTARAQLIVSILLVAAAGGWAVRSLGLHYRLHQMAFNVRNEWIHVDEWLDRQNETPRTPAAKQLVETLRNDAIESAVVNPDLLSPWGRQLIR